METVKVRIAVEVNSDGEWQAYGSDLLNEWPVGEYVSLEGNVARHWVEAEIAVPASEPETVKGEAVPA